MPSGATDGQDSACIPRYTCVSHETRGAAVPPAPTEGPLRVGAPVYSPPVSPMPELGDPCPGSSPTLAGAGK
jgi:hypothetical protein